jgi:LmbE family N-acetylglucosaminyl deacetylase
VIKVVSTEEDWSETLKGLTPWHPTASPIVLIAPHPDDETLGAGGLLAAQRDRGVDVTVVAVTDGENAYANCIGLGGVRRLEQERALDRLGIPAEKIIRFGLPDSSVEAHTNELIERLISLVSGSTHLLAPWRGDFHPDHEACGKAAEEVARRTGATLTSYFFWTWHLGSVALLDGLPLRSFLLTENQMHAKAEALVSHVSQLAHSSGEPILPQNLLGPARRSVEVFSVE